MQHSMTIWTNWEQIIYRINYIFFSYLRYRLYMMHMNIICTKFTIFCFKTKITYLTLKSIFFKAFSSCLRVPFIGIYNYLFFYTFNNIILIYYFIRVRNIIKIKINWFPIFSFSNYNFFFFVY